jgi:hypothetical protein
MTKDQVQWWARAAQSLSRAGFLWLALTAVALGSLVSSGSALAPSARLVAASNIGSSGKLKVNGSGSASVIPGNLTDRAQGPDTEAKRIPTGGTPVGLIAAALAFADPAGRDRLDIPSDSDRPAFRPAAFNARAPPARA